MKFTLALVILLSQFACMKSRAPIETEESQPAETESAELEPSAVPEVLVDEAESPTEVPSIQDAEKPIVETLEPFLAPIKNRDNNKAQSGVLTACAAEDFGLLTQSTVTLTDFWICGYDNLKNLVWLPQVDFKAKSIDEHLEFNPDDEIVLGTAQSFAFKQGQVVFWGWFLPFTGGTSNIISVTLMSQTGDEEPKTFFYNVYLSNIDDDFRSHYDTSDLTIRIDSVRLNSLGRVTVVDDNSNAILFRIEGISF